MSLDVDIRAQLGAFKLDASFRAPKGLTALLGRSGAGKSSIVNAVAGLLRPDDGHIVVEGTALFDRLGGIDVPVHRRRVGYVFQDARLFPHMTVKRNLSYGLRFTAPAQRGSDDEAAFRHTVEMLGIGHLLDRGPGGLSGGEAQRVAIGRTLLSRPRMLLLDEPLAALDDARKAEILPYLERVRDEAAVPILYVSHAVSEVARLATTVVVVEAGRITRAGPASDILGEPGALDMFAAREAGSLLTARVITGNAGDGLGEVALSGGRLVVGALDAPAGAVVRVRVHAQDVILARERPGETSALNVLPGTVVRIFEGGGAAVDVVVRCGDDEILARITRRSLARLDLAPGTPCHAILNSLAVSREDIGLAGGASHARPSSKAGGQ